MTRSQLGLNFCVFSLIGFALLMIGRAMGTTKTIIVTKLPEQIYCQPFKSKEVREAEAYYLKNLGFEQVMFTDLPKAFKAHSEGKGELLPQASGTCGERPGQIHTVRATTYYFADAKKVTTR